MLARTLEAPIGLSVEQAAIELGVAQPTVRKWVNEGLLKAVESRKPLEVEPRSVANLDRLLRRVREEFPAHQWTKVLAAFLHDRDLQDQEWFRRGAQERRRGEYVSL